MTENTTSTAPVRPGVTALTERPSAQVLIIGGGINGISTFRDLALQGIDVVLVERDDWVSGASSASSHMIHGGIRYLENGEFRLVRESVHERNGLLEIAPHYVKPLETTVPIFSTFSGILNAPRRFLTHNTGKPNERGAALIKAGLVMYDAFSGAGKRRVPRHKFRIGNKARADMPRLNSGIRYTATYFDASVHDPERLALDVLKDGLATGPHARAVNHVEAIAVRDGDVLLADRIGGKQFTVSAEVIVNASGPWTDLTNDALGGDTRYMGGTKGSHIVLDHPDLVEATRGREIFFEHSDGRIVLIYPLKDRVLVGTTDIDADPSTPTRCTDDEIEYFFDLIKHVFPDIAVSRDDIVYSFSGIRPLPRHDDTTPGFVSRDYNVERTQLPGVSVPVLSRPTESWSYSARPVRSPLSACPSAAVATTRPRMRSVEHGWPADAATCRPSARSSCSPDTGPAQARSSTRSPLDPTPRCPPADSRRPNCATWSRPSRPCTSATSCCAVRIWRLWAA